MLISLHDNYQRRIAHIDNSLPKAMHYNDDKWNRNLAYGTGIFEFTIDRQDLEHESQLVVGNYISFRYNNRDYMFTILRSEKSSDDKKIIVHSEYLSLGLLKSTQDPLDTPQSHTLEWYLTQSGILVNSGIKLGINEVPDLVRKIKIDGEQTALQRLTSFATNFGAEIEYVTTLNRDGTLKSLVVNFYKKFDGVNQGVGTNRQDLTLSYGKNVSGIKQTTDITDFFSMITPTGKDGLTITSLDRTEYDDKGNVLFFTRPGQSSIYAPQSAQRFPSRLIRTNNDYTDHKYSADGTSDQNTLYTLALNELKKYCDPSIVYDVTGFYDLNIGDTVKIFDASFNPPLMLQARVAEQTISFSNPSNNKTVFGNIVALESQASQDLTGRLKELVDQVTPYRFEIVSDNGLAFKNNEGATTLTARVFKGSNVDEVSVDSFEWLIDGVSFGGTTKSQLVNASQVTGTAVVRYNAKIGNTVIGGIEVTIQDISDGTNGTNGTNGKDGISPIAINMTNEACVFAGSTTSAIASSTTTTVVSYKGANAISATVGTISGLPTGMSYSVANNSTNSPVITFTVTTSMVSRTGDINIPLTIDGKSFTKVFSYALALQGSTGNTGANGTNGKDGTSVTITSKQILYQNSTSGTTAPTGTWSTTIPSTPQGQFRWARTIVNYSDGTSTQTDLVGYVGVDGQVGPQGKPTGITQQATEPSNKYAGMMWQYTGTSNITIGSTTIAPQVQYIYDGEQWIIYAINVANLNVQTLAALTADLGTVTAGMIKSYIDYTYYNNSATGIPAKAYLRIDATNANQKIALQSPTGVDWGYIRQDVNGMIIFTDANYSAIGQASGRYIRTTYSGAGLSFINSNNASINANGDLDVATPYTGTGSLYFDGTNLVSSAPIKTLADIGWTNTGVGSCRFKKNGNNVILDVNITPNAKPLTIGTLPIECRPSHALMQMGTSWSSNPNDGMHVQIDPNGKMSLYGTVGLGISTQILFGID